MQLTQYEQDMADGKFGKGLQKAIKVLIQYGDAIGAEHFVEISSAHVMPKEPPELLEEYTEDMASLPVKTTLHPHMSAFSPSKWEIMGIDEEYAQQESLAYEKRKYHHERLGFEKLYSCLPMTLGNLPARGTYNSWIGSGAQILCNSILGARTNRDGTVINMCVALTGRTPYHGLLKDENRYAQIVIRKAPDVKLETDADFGAMGYYVGENVTNKSVVFSNLDPKITFDQLKYLIAPSAASGSVFICHVVGVTPEAPTLEAALGGKKPEREILVTKKNIEDTKKKFAYNKSEKPSLVAIGCPHVTVEEAGKIASYLRGRKLRTGCRLWIAMSNPVYTLCKDMGYTDAIEKSGGVIANVCLATIPDSPLPEDVKTVLTNSFKAAHYIRSLQNGKVQVMAGCLEECLEAVTEQAEGKHD